MLDFYTLRSANVMRCNQVFHPLNAWTACEWSNALAGEVGEACNITKKMRRMQDGTNTAKDPHNHAEAVALLALELADVVIYADLLAASQGIDLALAVKAKFNAVSDRMGSHIKL